MRLLGELAAVKTIRPDWSVCHHRRTPTPIPVREYDLNTFSSPGGERSVSYQAATEKWRRALASEENLLKKLKEYQRTLRLEMVAFCTNTLKNRQLPLPISCSECYPWERKHQKVSVTMPVRPNAAEGLSVITHGHVRSGKKEPGKLGSPGPIESSTEMIHSFSTFRQLFS